MKKEQNKKELASTKPLNTDLQLENTSDNKEENNLTYKKNMTLISKNDDITLSKKDEKFRSFSLNGNMWRVILSIGAPLALYESLNQLFKILDTMMASHISAESVSAVAYLSQIQLMLSALGGGLAIGAGLKISEAYGAGDYKIVKQRVASLYAICVLLGLVILCSILPFNEKFLKLAGTPDSLISVGKEYFVVDLITMVIQFFNNVYIAVERARNNSKRILYLNLFIIVFKLTLTWIFVYKLNGDLVMVAYATLLAQIVMFLFGVFFIQKEKQSIFGFSVKSIKFNKKISLPMIKRSYPVVIEKTAFAFGKTVVNSMCKVYGDLTVGALGISNNIGGITTCPQNGFQAGAASIISQNVGAKKYNRVLKAFYVVVTINIIIGFAFFGITMLNLDFISNFFDSNNAEFHNMINNVYRYEAFGSVMLGINSAVLALLYGLGKTKVTLVLNTMRVFVFRIPVFWLLQNYTSYGSKSVGMVMMISNILAGTSSALVSLYYVKQLKKKIHETE